MLFFCNTVQQKNIDPSHPRRLSQIRNLFYVSTSNVWFLAVGTAQRISTHSNRAHRKSMWTDSW